MEREREQHGLEMLELREENESLKVVIKKAKVKVAKLEKDARQHETTLSRRKEADSKEAEVLAEFASAMEEKLESAQVRAAAAESQVILLKQELERQRDGGISGDARGQIKAAATQLAALATESEKSLRQLCRGVGALQHIHNILESFDRLSEVP